MRDLTQSMDDPAIEAAANVYLQLNYGVSKSHAQGWLDDPHRQPAISFAVRAARGIIRAYLAAQPATRTAESMREKLP